MTDTSPRIDVERTALIDGPYRYVLARRWRDDGPTAWFIMLNPSTADADTDDPTIRRCMGFALAWGMSSLAVLNLYAWRATEPKDLTWRRAIGIDVCGPHNDRFLRSLATLPDDDPIIAAWGAHAPRARADHVMAMPGMDRAQCLGTTKHGHPRHPLYIRSTTALQPYTHQPRPSR
ncbi:MAG: DUF1643 domain-containing protein [Frankiales bacterium]|nr:DUF1643 domain-containing protein [Frankiales bacterium]